MRQLGRLEARKSGGDPPQRKQEGGDVLRRRQPAVLEIIVQTEGGDATLAKVTLEFELPEIQLPDLIDKFVLLLDGQQARLVGETLGKGGAGCKRLSWVAFIPAALQNSRNQP